MLSCVLENFSLTSDTMDTSLRRRRSERQDPDFQDMDQAEALAAIPERDPNSPPSAEGVTEAHPFWSERAKAEVELQKARPQGLDEARRIPEVKVDDTVLEPSYELESGGKGRGAPASSDVIRAASGRADSHGPRGRGGLIQEKVEEATSMSSETGEGPTTYEPMDWMSMSPMKLEANLNTMMNDAKRPKLPENNLPANRRPLLEREPGLRSDTDEAADETSASQEVRNLSVSEVLDPRVVRASREVGPRAGDPLTSLETLEVFTTVRDGASERRVPNRSHLEADVSSARVGTERDESVSEGTARRSIPLSPEAQRSQKSSAYEIEDPLDHQFELARLRSLVEHLNDRLERAEAERSTRGSRSFGSASSGRRLEDQEIKGQRVNFQTSEGYPLPPVPPLPPFASEGWSSWNASDPLHLSPDLVSNQGPSSQSLPAVDFGASVSFPAAPSMDFGSSLSNMPGPVFSHSEVPSMDFGLHSSQGPQGVHFHSEYLRSSGDEQGLAPKAFSPSEVPSMDFGLHSSQGPQGAHSPSEYLRSSGGEQGFAPKACSPSEVPSMDFGLHPSASAGPQYFALTPRAQLPVSSGFIKVMGVNHRWKIVSGSLVLEPMEVIPPPPPTWTSFSVAAPPAHGAWSNCPAAPPRQSVPVGMPLPPCRPPASQSVGAPVGRYQSPPPRPPASTPPPSPPAPSGVSLPIAAPPVGSSVLLEQKDLRPEAVGKHVSSLPALEAYNPNNPTALGDWIAVVQPMISSLSDTGSSWWAYTYQAANQAYVRWLSTSPLERLSIQKEFDQVSLVQPQHALLEQRCVTLILQAIPDSVRVDIVASRHLSVAGMIFRLMTVFQPGGASERSTMLRFLVSPKAAATLAEAAKLLRQWSQWRVRLKQLHAAEPDTTLLVKGLDVLTGKALQKHSSSLFRLATFRERLGVDYQPTAEAVSELCRMLQAEVEHLVHSTDDSPVKEEVPGRGEESKKQRLQRLQASPNASKAKATPPGGPKLPGSGAKPCRSWLTPGGCTYGSSCQVLPRSG